MLTQAQVDLLRKPFAVQDHEHREGGKDGLLTYITEEPLIERLNEVDVSWSFKVISIIMSDYGGDRPDTVTVHAELTISGITRANVGTAISDAKLYDWRDGANGKRERYKLETPEIQPLGEKDIKGAVTDALKRCARMFGVGGYLLRLKGVTIRNEQDFARWYANEFEKPFKKPSENRNEPDAVHAEPEAIHDRARTLEDATVDDPFTDVTWTRDRTVTAQMVSAAGDYWKISGAHLYNRVAVALDLPAGNYKKRDDLLTAIAEHYIGDKDDARALLKAYKSEESAS